MWAVRARKWAIWSPGGGAARMRFQACGVEQHGQVVATRSAGSVVSMCGIAKESRAHPPHQRVSVPMTENPSGIAENGCAMTMSPASLRDEVPGAASCCSPLRTSSTGAAIWSASWVVVGA
jgi:hypothetical protein